MCAHSRRPFVRVDFSFLKSSRRQAPLAANTARHRQHGAPTRRGGAVDWLHPLPHSIHTSVTHVLYTRSEAVRRGGGGHKERETGGRVSTAMPAVRTLSLASRDVAQLTRSRFTPLGYRVNDAQSRSTFAKASFKC